MIDLGHLGDRERHHLADDDHEGRADVLGQMQGRAQLLDAAGECGQQSREAGSREFRHEGAGRADVHGAEIDRHAVEARLAHAVETFGGGSLGDAGAAQLRRPQGLVDAKRHVQARPADRTRGATGCRSVSSLIQIASSG